MKTLLFTFLLMPCFAISQEYRDCSRFITNDGWEILKGDTIILLKGSNSDGSYKYVYEKTEPLRDVVNKPAKIKKMVKHQLTDDTYECLLTVAGEGFEKQTVNINLAISSGEVTSPYPILPTLINTYPTLFRDTLFLSEDVKLYRGYQLKLGRGTLPDGDFKYIRISATSLWKYSGNDRRVVNSANAMPRTNSGWKWKIERFDRRGSKSNGFVYYPVLNTGLVRYEVDIVNAVETGEVVIEGAVKHEKQSEGSSIADELLKFKKLKDEGAITEEEYQEQKKKLLSK